MNDLKGLAAYDQARDERPAKAPCHSCIEAIHLRPYCSQACRWLDERDIARAMGPQK